MSKRKKKKRRQNTALKNEIRPSQVPAAQPEQHLTAEAALQTPVNSEPVEEAAVGQEQIHFKPAAQEPRPEQVSPEKNFIEEQQLEELRSKMQAEKSAAKATRPCFWLLARGLLLAAAALVLAVAVLWPRPARLAGADPAENAHSALKTGGEQGRAELLAQAMAQNSDVMAWLTLPGTQVDAPVLQTADNEYYLTRNESSEPDPKGCYFADYYSVFTSRSALNLNTIVYGWAQSEENAEGERFSQLFHYLDPAFAAKNPRIYLTLKEETLTFQVFAAFYTDTDFYYINSNPTGGAWQPFFETVQRLNQWQGEAVEVQPGDKLLTLSTVAYQPDDPKARFVVMAKLLPQQGAVDLPAATVTAPPPATLPPSPAFTPSPALTATATPAPSASPVAGATPRPIASPAASPTPAAGLMTEPEFWQQVLVLVQEAPKASLIKVDAGLFENVPQAVLKALFGKDVNLLVIQNGQSDLIINGINMYRHTKKEIYTLPDLRGAYKGFTLENSKAPVDKPGLDLSAA